MLNKTNPLLIS